jgi:hypothetical protein
MKNKEKIPSQFSIRLSPIFNINLKFINLCNVKNHVLKHIACLVLEHAPKYLCFLFIKIDRVHKEHFGHFKKGCGRAENRTRNCWVTTNCFTTKLLAHKTKTILDYLNFN